MLRFRYIQHAVRSAKFLCSKGLTYYTKAHIHAYKFLFEHKFRNIRRGQRDRCWCGGELLPFKWYPSYGVCANCGCYVNRRPPVKESLEKLYTMDLYWKTMQKMKGIPKIQKRASLYRSDGRLNQWLHLIEQYGPRSGRVIEIGCAPGVLLEELHKRGYECIGVEISKDVADWIRNKTGLDIHSGFFPGIDLPPCHLFLSFDVLEHSPCPEDFMREVKRLLLPKGVAIIQTAIDRYDYTPPFGERFDMFDDLEHLFLFTNKAMEALALKAGLEIVSLKERIWLAGEIGVFRKP